MPEFTSINTFFEPCVFSFLLFAHLPRTLATSLLAR
jgi:hypothetical protein